MHTHFQIICFLSGTSTVKLRTIDHLYPFVASCPLVSRSFHFPPLYKCRSPARWSRNSGLTPVWQRLLVDVQIIKPIVAPAEVLQNLACPLLSVYTTFRRMEWCTRGSMGTESSTLSVIYLYVHTVLQASKQRYMQSATMQIADKSW